MGDVTIPIKELNQAINVRNGGGILREARRGATYGAMFGGMIIGTVEAIHARSSLLEVVNKTLVAATGSDMGCNCESRVESDSFVCKATLISCIMGGCTVAGAIAGTTIGVTKKIFNN